MDLLQDLDAVKIGVCVAAALIAWVSVRRFAPRGTSRSTARQPDRFSVLATRLGGTKKAERYVEYELQKGASTRAEAVENAIERHDIDRRSWR